MNSKEFGALQGGQKTLAANQKTLQEAIKILTAKTDQLDSRMKALELTSQTLNNTVQTLMSVFKDNEEQITETLDYVLGVMKNNSEVSKLKEIES